MKMAVFSDAIWARLGFNTGLLAYSALGQGKSDSVTKMPLYYLQGFPSAGVPGFEMFGEYQWLVGFYFS